MLVGKSTRKDTRGQLADSDEEDDALEDDGHAGALDSSSESDEEVDALEQH